MTRISTQYILHDTQLKGGGHFIFTRYIFLLNRKALHIDKDKIKIRIFHHLKRLWPKYHDHMKYDMVWEICRY